MRSAGDAQRIALRDTLAAVLRDAPQPMTAGEAGDQTRTWWAALGGGIGTTRAYTSLEAMAKAGPVEKIKLGRSVYWQWIGEPVDMSAFESASAG